MSQSRPAREWAALRLRWRGALRFALRASGAALLVALVAAALFVVKPLPEGLLDYRGVASVKLLDREGQLLRELLSRADGRSTPIAAEEMAPAVRAAFIAAEDRHFFSHVGVSGLSILRAAWQNLKAGRVVAGGSTLTQQLARNLVPRPRTLAGKVQEALWALRLEAHLSKEEILTQFLNRVPFGNQTFGLEAASQLYFGRKARHLSLAQAATLAAIPRGPSAYNPYRASARLEARKRWVLSRLQHLGSADADDVRRALDEPLDLRAFETAFRAPHWVDFVARNLERWGLGEATVVETSLDATLQAQVEEGVARELTALEERRVGSAAVLVTDNPSGEVLAYVGSGGYFDLERQGQNDGVQMRRQPGSALKPFVYGEAFESGLTPATVVADLDSHFRAGKGSYAPKNYDRRAHGPVRLREALASSFNVPAVRLAELLGPERVLATLRRAGFQSLVESSEHYGLGLALGNGEVSLWELANAYRGLARGGVLDALRPVRRAWRADGSEIALDSGRGKRRFLGRTAVALVTDILADNSARARAFGLDSSLRLPFPAAAKTGTSRGYSDNWTAGYTRERTVAVWAGNFDGTPMSRVSGITGAGPIFQRAMVAAMENVTPSGLVELAGLERVAICPLSGGRAGPHCAAAMGELFPKGRVPREPCAMHGAVASSLEPKLEARCRQLAEPGGRLADLGAEYYEWARAEGLAEEPWLASSCRQGGGAAGGATGGASVDILFPAEGDEFLLLPDLPLGDQSIPLRVQAPPGEGALEVWLDGKRFASLEPPYTARLAATQGEHVVAVHRKGGPAPLSRVRFQVRGEGLPR